MQTVGGGRIALAGIAVLRRQARVWDDKATMPVIDPPDITTQNDAQAAIGDSGQGGAASSTEYVAINRPVSYPIRRFYCLIRRMRCATVIHAWAELELQR
jgi:hypothetical protein